MGYGDDRYGRSDRWQSRDEGRGWGRESGRYGRDDDDRGRYGRERSRYGRDDDDRGFFDRAGDEEAERRREMDERRWEREQRMRGGRDRDYDRDDVRGGWASTGPTGMTGWGNQSGEAWNRDRPGVRERRDRDEQRGRFGGSDRGERGDRDDGDERYGGGYGGYGADNDAAIPFRETGYGGAAGGNRFDRIDAGSTGTHGAHPRASYGGAYGAGGIESGARERAILAQSRGGRRSGRSESHDPHYQEWRSRQLSELDRDYDEWRREHQSRFDEEFGRWRTRRQSQRQMLGNVDDGMDVVGSDGERVGTVDKVRGDRIILTKNDERAHGVHHSVPCGWLERVEDKVILNRTADQAMREWRDEDRNRALFESPDSGTEGPHALNRSFAGTYDEDDTRK